MLFSSAHLTRAKDTLPQHNIIYFMLLSSYTTRSFACRMHAYTSTVTCASPVPHFVVPSHFMCPEHDICTYGRNGDAFSRYLHSSRYSPTVCARVFLSLGEHNFSNAMCPPSHTHTNTQNQRDTSHSLGLHVI